MNEVMEQLEDDDEKTNIYIIGDDGKVTHSEDDQSKSFVEKLSSIEQALSSDSEDPNAALKIETTDDIAPQKRILFGPPSWNPEQLATAIKAVVQDGVSLTVAARENGIPRTTLANKIYGRKRKRTNESSTGVTSSAFHSKTGSTSYTSLISSEQEKMLAEVLARQRHVDSYSMTRAVFDLVKYFARERNIVLSDDEEMKDWLKFFFLRYPSSRFTVWHTEHGKFENDDRLYEDFVLDAVKSEHAEEVKRHLFQYIQRKTSSPTAVHLFWWYGFLVKYKTVKKYFIDHLKWPNSLLDDCYAETNADELQAALTNILLNRYHHGSHSTNHSFSSSANQNHAVTSVANQSQLVKVITGEHSDSPTQVIPRRKLDCSYRTILPKPRDQISSDDTFESSDVSITSTSKSSSFSVMLAQEGLVAVEKKLSTDELRYFCYRLENPQLEEAYHIWKNLKLAVLKKENDTDVCSG